MLGNNGHGYGPGNDWIQIDLGTIRDIAAVATQGRADHPQWPLELVVEGSIDGSEFSTIAKFASVNADQNTVKVLHFPQGPVSVRFMKLLPVKSHNTGRIINSGSALRCEVLMQPTKKAAAEKAAKEKAAAEKAAKEKAAAEQAAADKALKEAEEAQLAAAIAASLDVSDPVAPPPAPVTRVKRWGDGLEAPAAGSRNFVPHGFQVTLRYFQNQRLDAELVHRMHFLIKKEFA